MLHKPGTMGTAISFSGGNTAPASYTVEGAANCSAPATAAVSLSPGGSVAAATINLTGCQ
jgi:hypothetical protein